MDNSECRWLIMRWILRHRHCFRDDFILFGKNNDCICIDETDRLMFDFEGWSDFALYKIHRIIGTNIMFVRNIENVDMAMYNGLLMNDDNR